MFRRDLLNDGEELVGERSQVEVLFGDLSVSITLRLLVVRNVAELVAVSLDQSAPVETKPEVMRLDVLSRLLCPDEIEQRSV